MSKEKSKEDKKAEKEQKKKEKKEKKEKEKKIKKLYNQPLNELFEETYGAEIEAKVAECIEKFIDLGVETEEFINSFRECLSTTTNLTDDQINDIIVGLGGHIHVGGG
ncbi:MAG: hypothetical protein ACW96X_04300 [Promethearchaeota archaeon]|jgi:hypothetical protein